MRFGRSAAALLLLAGAAAAAGINTDVALTVGEGQVVSRTQARWTALRRDVEAFLLEETVLYGVTPDVTVFATLGHVWSDPGPDGLTDLLLRGRWKLLARDARRATLSLALIGGVEAPLGEEPIGSPDGGVRGGLVLTLERGGWRLDADVENAWRPNAPDALRADVALGRIVAETDAVLWQGVLELNYRAPGVDDVLFVAPGVVAEIRGWKFEASFQVAVAADTAGPEPRYAAVLGVVHVF